MVTPSAPLTLVADVGGTNTRVGLAHGAQLDAAQVLRFQNAEFPDLGAVLAHYLDLKGSPVCAGACAAVAGPVKNGVGALTNLDWQIDEDTLRAATGAAKAAILNDLQAQGYGLAHIAPENLRNVLPGQDKIGGDVKLVIGVGTGFNIAPVYPAQPVATVGAAEAGHMGLPVQNSKDLSLSEYLCKIHGFADVEEALSGRGLRNIYGWLTDDDPSVQAPSGQELMAAFEAETDPTAIQTAHIFARLLGAVAGDLALLHLPYGGIYFSGGVARAFGPHLAKTSFADAFHNKGRFSELMTDFTVNVIEDDFAALSGCADYVCGLMGRAL